MPDESDRLSTDDAHILGLESASITGHTLKLIVLEPGTALDVEALQADVAERLPGQPRATHRVDTSGPEPRWVPATDFDIAEHVRRRTDASCVSQADLWRIVSALMSEHLDPAGRYGPSTSSGRWPTAAKPSPRESITPWPTGSPECGF